jgi:hypothetical protein
MRPFLPSLAATAINLWLVVGSRHHHCSPPLTGMSPSSGHAPSSSIPTPREPMHSRLGPITSHIVYAAPPAGAAATQGVDVPCSPLSAVSPPLETGLSSYIPL